MGRMLHTIELHTTDGVVTVGGIHLESMREMTPTRLTQIAECVPLLCSSSTAVWIGDFNAAWGHPGFRRLVRAGWRDAHRELGRGLTNSWPTDRRWAPPFVRLDHALVGAEAEVVDVTDVDVPGSDHRGIVVRVRRASRSAS